MVSGTVAFFAMHYGGPVKTRQPQFLSDLRHDQAARLLPTGAEKSQYLMPIQWNSLSTANQSNHQSIDTIIETRGRVMVVLPPAIKTPDAHLVFHPGLVSRCF